MSEDFDRENDLKFVAQPYLFEPEHTDEKLREMDVLRQNMHALWYSRKHALKTDIEENILSNKAIFFLCAQKVFLQLHKIKVEPLMSHGLF